MKRINKQINQDLSNVTIRLNSNKIFLNINETQVASLISTRKQTDVFLKLKLNGKNAVPYKCTFQVMIHPFLQLLRI